MSRPACAARRGNRIVFLKDGKVIGCGTVDRIIDGKLAIFYAFATMDFAKGDEIVGSLGDAAMFLFDPQTGEYVTTYDNERGDRCEGVTILGSIDFAFGLASRERYGHIRGFGIYDVSDPDNYFKQALALSNVRLQ